MICSKCGQEFAEDVKFCTKCGTKLTAAGAAGEEKQEAAVTEENKAETAVAEAEEKKAETEAAVTEENKTEPEAAEEKKAETEAAEAEENKAETEAAEAGKEDEAAAVTGEAGVAETEQGNAAGKEEAKKDNPEKAGAKKNISKLIMIGAASVAAVLLIILLVVVCSGGKDYIAISNKSVLDVYEQDDDYFVYFENGKTLKLNDSVVNVEAASMDRTAFCYTNESDEVMVIKDGKVIKTGIEEAEGIKMSLLGDTLAYYSDCEYENSVEIGTLHLYDIKKKKDIEIEDEVLVGSAVLSPNGKTIAYVADYDAADDFKGYYSVTGKKPVEVGKEKRVFAIADKGGYLYYTDDDRIYVQKKKKEAEKLASDLYGTVVLMNADCTEMLFQNDGKTYITVKAGEKQKVYGKELDAILLNDDGVVGSDAVSSALGTVQVSYTGVDSLKEKLFLNSYDDEIVYLKKNFEAERLASNARRYAIADDGESLLYIDSMELVRVTNFAKGGAKADLTDDAEATRLYANGDLKYIYYVNDDEELYCIKGRRVRKIADDVTSATVSADGTYCYYVVDEEKLCYSKKAGKGKEIFKDDEAEISCWSNLGIVNVRVSTEEKTESYRVEDKKMKLYYSYEY